MGLDMAYGSPTDTVLYKDAVYVAGTHPELSARGMKHMLFDDSMLMPFMQVHLTQRYEHLDDLIKIHKLAVISGHSLEAAVVAKWVKDHPYWPGHARIYDAPRWRLLGVTRGPIIFSYTRFGDPIGMLDWDAESTWGTTHTYG